MTLSQISRFLIVLSLLLLNEQILASKPGKASLMVRQAGAAVSRSSWKAGDLLDVELRVDAKGEEITGVAVFLTFDDTYFELVPAFQTDWQLRPFWQGGWLQGTIFSNETLGDQIGDSSANKRAGFQLYYFENVPASFTGDLRAASGEGVLAYFRVQLVREIQDPLSAVEVEAVSPVGSESGYFVKSDPGSLYSLQVVYAPRPEILTGDFSGDMQTDFQDFLLFVQHYGLTLEDPEFLAVYDLDGDRKIGFGDFMIFAAHFGQSPPAK